MNFRLGGLCVRLYGSKLTGKNELNMMEGFLHFSVTFIVMRMSMERRKNFPKVLSEEKRHKVSIIS